MLCWSPHPPPPSLTTQKEACASRLCYFSAFPLPALQRLTQHCPSRRVTPLTVCVHPYSEGRRESSDLAEALAGAKRVFVFMTADTWRKDDPAGREEIAAFALERGVIPVFRGGAEYGDHVGSGGSGGGGLPPDPASWPAFDADTRALLPPASGSAAAAVLD